MSLSVFTVRNLGNVFTPVCHSVHRGCVCIPPCTGQRGVCIPACTGQGGGVYPSMHWAEGCVHPSMHWQGGGVYPIMHWAESVSQHALGGGCLPHPPGQTPPSRDGHCSGRYASYRNAFFFSICTDVDECGNSDSNNCNENADCINTYGSYLCTCNSGKGGSARKISTRSFSFKFNTNKV